MNNLVPQQYREVAVATVDFPLEEGRLRVHLMGREVYRRTRYVVFRRRQDTAVVEVAGASTDQVMATVTGISVLALPAACAFVQDPEVDTGVPSDLAAAAAARAPWAHTVVVEGRYHHVNFIHAPAPIGLRVVDLVPPGPPKLLDQARRVLALAEDLPPIRLVPGIVDLRDLARSRPAAQYLLPCRGSGFELSGLGAGGEGPVPGVPGPDAGSPLATGIAEGLAEGLAVAPEVAFLDERPPRQEWTLIGCARSRELHRWFYRDLPDYVDMCPRRLAAASPGLGPTAAVTLTKCCLLEDRIEHDQATVVVPWGASLDQVRQGLRAAADLATTLGPPPRVDEEPAWSPG